MEANERVAGHLVARASERRRPTLRQRFYGGRRRCCVYSYRRDENAWMHSHGLPVVFIEGRDEALALSTRTTYP